MLLLGDEVLTVIHEIAGTPNIPRHAGRPNGCFPARDIPRVNDEWYVYRTSREPLIAGSELLPSVKNDLECGAYRYCREHPKP